MSSKKLYYDEEFIRKICNSECSYNDLSRFHTVLKSKNNRLKGNFNQHFDINQILSAIEKFESD